MLWTRRRLMVAAAAVAAFPRIPHAADFPTRPITLVVPYGPGSSTDLMARLLADKVSPLLGQRMIIDNRVGGSGLVGTERVALAAPDGYTLVLGANNTHAVAPSLFTRLPYDPVRSFAPVTLLVSQPQAVVVHPSLKVRTVAELIAYARANPGKLNYGSTGLGTGAHLAAECLNHAAGIDIVHVPYSGGAGATEGLISNQVQVMFYPYMPMKLLIENGDVVAIATTGYKRSPWLPELPTMIESGFAGFAFPSWYAIYAPVGTPADVIKRLDDAFRAVLQDSATLSVLTANGTDSLYAGPDGLAQFTASEIERYRKVLADAHVEKVNN